jgi:predicted metal-dependent hydrolase
MTDVNKDSQVIQVDDIGPVLLEHSRRARRITINIKPGKGIRVAVPHYSSFKSALGFVDLKKDWIKKTQARIQRIRNRQQILNTTYPDIDKAKAEEILLPRLRALAEKYGFTYNRVSIRGQKTRWGSCTHNNNLNLNMKILVLPDEIIDYVLLHELVHTRIYNHSRKFWNELSKYVPNAKEMDKRLREYDLRFIVC